jgi:catalase
LAVTPGASGVADHGETNSRPTSATAARPTSTYPRRDRTTPEAHLTTNQGIRVSDNQNQLKSGERGPVLLEDFVLREKIFHFDHERIPERIVHARGSAAHGFSSSTSRCRT